MKKSINQKTRRGRPATGRGTMVSSRMPQPSVDAVDEWALSNETTRSDAIRQLVELGLTIKPKAKQRSPASAARAKELAKTAIGKMTDTTAAPDERAQRRHQLTKGPAEFRDSRIDQPKAKGK
jgi:hypothetical protein